MYLLDSPCHVVSLHAHPLFCAISLMHYQQAQTMPLSDLVGFIQILHQARQTLLWRGCAAFVPEHFPHMVALI